MNIVVLSQTYLKEINRDKFSLLAQYAEGEKYKITLALMKNRCDTLFTTYAEESPFLDIELLPIVANGIEPVYFFSPLKFYKTIKDIQPDIIHVENPTGSFVLLQVILTKLLACPKAKIVVFTWLNMPYPTHPKFWLYRVIERFNLRFVDTLICGTNDGKKLFEKRWYKKQIHVMPQLGVDPAFFIKKDASWLREKLGLTKDNFVFGSIGRLVVEKWLEDELIAFAQIAKMHPHIRLLLVGKWPHKSNLEQLVATLHIEDKVIRVASVTHEEVVDYINLCDVHVLASYEIPSRKEQFGHILIECMSCGVPVIGSDSGEIPFVIEDAGIVFPARNIQALADAMERMLTDTVLRTTCIQKWKERVERWYTHQKIAQELDTIYQTL